MERDVMGDESTRMMREMTWNRMTFHLEMSM
jgi:hypothetical protein